MQVLAAFLLGRTSLAATVEKGYIARDAGGFAHIFAAALVPMLLTIVECVNLSRRDRATLQKIVDKIE